jgi:CubicO group peptidase (beta-lactamase class C family)
MQSYLSLSMRIFVIICLIIAGIVMTITQPGQAAELSRATMALCEPESVGLLSSHLKFIDDAVQASIWAGETPGAVVLVARHGCTAYFKAFGNRAVEPKKEAMTTDTIFDVSSLTKVVATAPSIMLLVENGIVRLDDKVKRYLPNFTGGGKDAITVKQLLTHYSGLAPDFDLSKSWHGHSAALEELWKIKTDSDPGKEFVYSDLNYIALGEIVRATSGSTLDEFAREKIFVPLGMKDTCFRPPASLIARIAPTEPRKNTLRYLKGQGSEASMEKVLRGEVHDPTAWKMGGVAGHAGLFSTARDIALYAQMLLDKGKLPSGGRILSPLGVEAMTRPQNPPASTQLRGLGWDIESSYTSPRGDIFNEGFGHTGFSGTSLWIHPLSDAFVIVLTNRVHPDGGKDVNHLRAVIANIVATSISDSR